MSVITTRNRVLRIVSVLLIALMLLSTACSQRNAPVLSAGDASASALIETEPPIELDSPTQDASQPEEELSDEIYAQAMEKWSLLGGCEDFKNIETIDSYTLAKACAYYLLTTGRLNYGESYDDYQIPVADFDQFVTDYFGLSPEKYHQAISTNEFSADPEKGFNLYMIASKPTGTQTVEMLEKGKRANGDSYFIMQNIYERSEQELASLYEGAPKTKTSKTLVCFQYTNDMVHFVEAYYQTGSSSSFTTTPVLDYSAQDQSQPEDELSDEIYTQAVEKWSLLSSMDFKSIEIIDTYTLIQVCSSYMLHTGRISWDAYDYDTRIPVADFDEFVVDYFGLPPDVYHQDYLGNDDTYDPEKGFLMYNHVFKNEGNAKREIVSKGITPHGDYYVELQSSGEYTESELSLLRSGTPKNFMSKTIVCFRYTNDIVHFVEAYYS
jgi:hypothetical protein